MVGTQVILKPGIVAVVASVSFDVTSGTWTVTDGSRQNGTGPTLDAATRALGQSYAQVIAAFAAAPTAPIKIGGAVADQPLLARRAPWYKRMFGMGA